VSAMAAVARDPIWPDSARGDRLGISHKGGDEPLAGDWSCSRENQTFRSDGIRLSRSWNITTLERRSSGAKVSIDVRASRLTKRRHSRKNAIDPIKSDTITVEMGIENHLTRHCVLSPGIDAQRRKSIRHRDERGRKRA
jgi:hypothetical protein